METDWSAMISVMITGVCLLSGITGVLSVALVALVEEAAQRSGKDEN